MVQIVNLVKQYGKHLAVNNLNLTIPGGSIFGFVGPNGAGKTTTMKIMVGLLTATCGSVLVDDVDIIKNERARSKTIGYMPDFFGVYDNLKVDEYIDFYADAYRIPYRERAALIGNLLELVDLTHKKDSYVDALSRGMKQRLCLARSMIHDPDVLVLDEPASGLDPRARIEMKEILKQLRQLGKSVIISSHILTELAEMCTSLAIIDQGRVTATGSISDIMRTLQQKRVIYVKPLDKIGVLLLLLRENPAVAGVVENAEDVEFHFNGSEAALAALLKEMVSREIPIISFREKEGNLEEIFMTLTGGGTPA